MKLEDFKIGKKYKKIGGRQYVGDIVVCSHISTNSVEFEGPGIYSGYALDWFEPVEEPLQYGDKVTVNNGKWTYFYLMTTPDGSIITVNSPNTELLEEDGYIEVYNWGDEETIRKVEPVKVDTTVEVTMSDIAEAMGINIDDLKIINQEK